MFFFFFSLFEAFLRSTPSNFSYHRLSSSSRRWNSLADLHAMAARLPSILSPPCILCEYESCIYLGLEQRGCSSNFSSNPLEKKLRAAATYRTISSLNRATKILYLSVFLSLFNSFSLRFFWFFSILERRRRREGEEKERERRRRKKKISGVIESLDVFRIKILKYSFRGIKASKLLRFASFIQGFSANIFFSSFFLRFLRPTARSKCFVSDIPLSSFSLAKT